MIRGGFRRYNNLDDDDFRFLYRNEGIHRICNTKDVSEFVKTQQCKYAAHLIRVSNDTMTKKLLFQDDKCTKRGRNTNTLFNQVLGNFAIEKQSFINKAKDHYESASSHPKHLI